MAREDKTSAGELEEGRNSKTSEVLYCEHEAGQFKRPIKMLDKTFQDIKKVFNGIDPGSSK